MIKKEFKIICSTQDTIDCFTYLITIYDNNKKQLYQGFTDQKGVFTFLPPYLGLYWITIQSKNTIPNLMIKSIFIGRKQTDCRFGFFLKKMSATKPIT